MEYRISNQSYEDIIQQYGQPSDVLVLPSTAVESIFTDTEEYDDYRFGGAPFSTKYIFRNPIDHIDLHMTLVSGNNTLYVYELDDDEYLDIRKNNIKALLYHPDMPW